MRFFGYPYNDLVICKDSPDYLRFRALFGIILKPMVLENVNKVIK